MIAVVGEALFDAHLDGDVLCLFAGGGPFNTAIALARLRTPVRFIGAISGDRLGRQLEEKLRSAGVDVSRCAPTHAPTPLAIVDDAEGEPTYGFYLSGTAHEALLEHDLTDLEDDVAALHVGTLALATDPPGAIVAAFAEREARRRTLIVDPNVRPALIPDRDAYVRRFEQLAAVADLVKLSSTDLAWLYPGRDSKAAVARLLAAGTGCVALTHGPGGAEGWTASGSATVAAPAVTVVDTVGAGDAFGAGMLAWLWRSDHLNKQSIRCLQSNELRAALAYAAATGAAQCTRASAWGPTTADVERVLKGARSPASRPREEGEWLRSSSVK